MNKIKASLEKNYVYRLSYDILVVVIPFITTPYAFLPAKNHLFMVSVFEEVLKRIPNAVLWFIGDGPNRPEIERSVKEKQIQDSVMFLGVRKDVSKL